MVISSQPYGDKLPNFMVISSQPYGDKLPKSKPHLIYILKIFLKKNPYLRAREIGKTKRGFLPFGFAKPLCANFQMKKIRCRFAALFNGDEVAVSANKVPKLKRSLP